MSRFCVGDRVIAMMDIDLQVPAGTTGRIVASDDSHIGIAVEFDVPELPEGVSHLHTIGGMIGTRRGYWCLQAWIDLVDDVMYEPALTDDFWT